MLRIAVPNKGSLSEPAAAMLKEAGYRIRRDPKELVVTDADNGVELFYLRPRDIAVYVGSGTVDCGITGRDLLLDSGSAAVELMALGFGASTFRYAARPGTATAMADVAGHRVATSYPGLVEKHLADHGVSASVVRLDGAVETAITLGVADVIAGVKGPVIVVSNLLTEGQGMREFSAADEVAWVSKTIGRKVDVVIANEGQPSRDAVARYAAEDKHPLPLGTLDGGTEAVVGDFWRSEIARHDRRRLSYAVWSVLSQRLMT